MPGKDDATGGRSPGEVLTILGPALLEELSPGRRVERIVQDATRLHWDNGAPGSAEAVAVIRQALLVLTGDRAEVDLDTIKAFGDACVAPPARTADGAGKGPSRESKLRKLVRLVGDCVSREGGSGPSVNDQETSALLNRIRRAFPGEFDAPQVGAAVANALLRYVPRAEAQKIPRGHWTEIGAAAHIAQQAKHAEAWGYSGECPDDALDRLKRLIDKVINRRDPALKPSGSGGAKKKSKKNRSRKQGDS